MIDIAARKRPTLDRIARQQRLKLFAIPAVAAIAGLGLKLFAGFQPVEALINWSQAVWLTFTNEEALKAWIADHVTVAWLIDWLAAPVTLFVLAYTLVRFSPVRWLIDRAFPAPPAFVFADLDAEREATMIRLERSALPLIGREAELNGLTGLLDKGGAVPAFRWQMLSGPSGVGKTRLGIEWLAKAEALGWDFGIVDPDDSELLKGWRARRPTALVLDEARSAWPELEKAIGRLQAGSSVRSPVRLLVVAQIAPYAAGAAPEEIGDSEALPALTLNPLDGEGLAELGRALAPDGDRAATIVRESGGRPRAAIILANAEDAADLAEAMAAWAYRMVPELRSEAQWVDESLALGLIAAGLAGPIAAAHLKEIAGGFSVLPLLRFFPSARQEQLESTLPALLPEDLGQELALRLLPRLGTGLRDAAMAMLIERAPARIEASLGSIWSDHTGYFDRATEHDRDSAEALTLRAMQRAFDNRWPERAGDLARLANEYAVRLAVERTDPKDRESHLFGLATLARSRPFDHDIRLCEAKGAVSAINHYGIDKEFGGLERWGARLIALGEHPEFSTDVSIRLCEAEGAVNAIGSYGVDRNFEGLERWGARLLALTEHPDFSTNTEIRLCEAKGAVNAMGRYGGDRNFEGLERWGARLLALAEHPNFSTNTEMRLCEAKGAVNAINGYGKYKNFEGLERWGARLLALAEHPNFSTDARIRLHEAMGAFNAMTEYGKDKNFDALERWGARVLNLTECPGFSTNTDIRLREAMCAHTAIIIYGHDKNFMALERWGAHLTALAEDPGFSTNAEIRLYEAEGAVSAMYGYGQDKNSEGLERWGARLIALAEDPGFSINSEIRLCEAEGAVNATAHYGRDKNWEALERWAARLIVLAGHSDFSTNADIRLCEAKGAANALGHMRASGISGSGRYNFWRDRLGRIALAFPYHGEIQACAKNWSVGYLDQRSRGWPYGKGK